MMVLEFLGKMSQKDVKQTERVSQDYERDIREVKIDGLQRDHTYQLQIQSLSRGEISDAKSATATTGKYII